MAILEAKSDDIKSQIKNFGAPHYFLIVGDELLMQSEAVETITEIYTNPKGPMHCEDIMIYTDADKYDLNELLLDANQAGLFGIRKLHKFIFNNKPSEKILNDMAKLAAAQDMFHVYIFNFLQWDKKNDSSKLVKQLEQNPGFTGAFKVICKPLTGDKYVSWIRQRLKKMHFEYEAEVPKYLEEMFEHSMFALQQVLTQLKIRGITQLTIAEINKTASLSSDYTVFDFIDALIYGDLAKVNYIIDYLVFTKKTDTSFIIAMLRNLLLKIYELRNRNSTKNSPVLFISEPFFAEVIEPQQQEKLKKTVFDNKLRKQYSILLSNRINRKWLYEMFVFLTDIEIAMKTRDAEQKIVEFLKQFCLKFVTDNQSIDYDLFKLEATGEVLPNW